MVFVLMTVVITTEVDSVVIVVETTFVTSTVCVANLVMVDTAATVSGSRVACRR